jgi:Fe-S cluster biogenesis protein NfuA
MFIQTEATPNPATLKFLPGRDVYPGGSIEFHSTNEANISPLASALFGVEGVRRVFFGPDFVTVTKVEGVEWSHVKPSLLGAIMDHFTSGRPVVIEETVTTAAAAASDITYDADSAQIVKEIIELIDTRVRPAVAQDGGDILFDRFEPDTGKVFLHMRGACAGCPSSTYTLKSGIENMLRHYVPEVTSVEAAL